MEQNRTFDAPVFVKADGKHNLTGTNGVATVRIVYDDSHKKGSRWFVFSEAGDVLATNLRNVEQAQESARIFLRTLTEYEVSIVAPDEEGKPVEHTFPSDYLDVPMYGTDDTDGITLGIADNIIDAQFTDDPRVILTVRRTYNGRTAIVYRGAWKQDRKNQFWHDIMMMIRHNPIIWEDEDMARCPSDYWDDYFRTEEERNEKEGGKFFNDPEDCVWVWETKLDKREDMRPGIAFRSFILYGNEDAPEWIDLFTDQEPKIWMEPRYTVRLL